MRPATVTAQAWKAAIEAGWHATDTASHSDVEAILCAALSLLPSPRNGTDEDPISHSL